MLGIAWPTCWALLIRLRVTRREPEHTKQHCRRGCQYGRPVKTLKTPRRDRDGQGAHRASSGKGFREVATSHLTATIVPPKSKHLGTLAALPRSPLLPYEHVRQQSRRAKLLRLTGFQRPALLLAVTAEARPGHRFQSCFSDGTVTSLTHPEGTVLDPSQCLVDGPQKVTVTLAQMHLKSRFDFLRRPIGRVPSMTLFFACSQQSSEGARQQLLPLSQQ